MKKSLHLCILLSLLLTSSVALASGSSRITSTGPDPMLVTRTLTCTVTAVADQGRIRVKDDKSSQEVWIQVTSRTKLLAKNKALFDGRKKLSVEDLAKGQVVKITHRPHTGEVTKIRVLRTG